MSRFHDLVGVLRGLQKFQRYSSKECYKTRNDTLNSLKSTLDFSFPNISQPVSNVPTTLFKSISILSYQIQSLISYKIKLLNEKEEFTEDIPEKYTKAKSENKDNQSEHVLDPLDLEIIEQFRQQHPEIIKQEDEKVSKNLGNKTMEITQDVKRKLDFSVADYRTDDTVSNASVPSPSQGHERRVPSSEVGRAMSFASLFARVGAGALAESAKRTMLSSDSSAKSSVVLSEANMERIVDSLCRVRGAALKLAQMLSIQDSEFVDPRLLQIMERVRHNADFMPLHQMHKVMKHELGENWREKFAEFDESKPFAAASIGQVHKAKLLDEDGSHLVAVKIQYPGVKRSINSDINNLTSLLRLVKLLPPGLHADQAITVAKRELAWECDYLREAEYSQYFLNQFQDDPVFEIPEVVSHLTTDQVLTTRFVEGVSIDKCEHMNQEVRDWVGTHMLRLCLTELFHLKTMQTDPNWSNFLFNFDKRKIYLIDFGASRHYDSVFVDEYLRVIYAASIQDRKAILTHSRNLGFLTGLETRVMEEAHVEAVSVLGEVFSSNTTFDFSAQSTTRRIKRLIPVMLEHRLTSPPEETYSLHRKLAGGFLLCSKLRSRVSCRPLFQQIYSNYKFSS